MPMVTTMLEMPEIRHLVVTAKSKSGQVRSFIVKVNIPRQPAMLLLKSGQSAGGQPCIEFIGALKLTNKIKRLFETEEFTECQETK